jgi:hypothetical protein
VEELLGDLVQRRKGIYASVIDENVELAEGLFRLGEEASDVGLLRYVCLHGDGLATRGGDAGDHVVRSGLAGRVVDDHRSALGCERTCDLRADALRCSGYDSDFICKLAHDVLPRVIHFDTFTSI